MPRNRINSRIDDELVIAKEALAFWRDQIFLADVALRDCARSAVRLREEEIACPVEIQEALASRCSSAD